METTLQSPKTISLHRWGGAAFILGNVLFLVNKFDEMSRLFLGRPMPDVISGQDILLIAIGQVALIIGYVAWFRHFAPRVGGPAKNALRLFSVGGVVLAVGHFVFMEGLAKYVPYSVLRYGESLFALVIIGLLLLLIGLIWFGILNLRQPRLNRWQWLPLATGLTGFIGFFLFSGEEITATFLLFRTLFALGLIGMGLSYGWSRLIRLRKDEMNKLIRWLIATTIGFTLTGAMFHFPSGFPPNNFNSFNGGAAIVGAIMGAMTGVIIGLLQWGFLRPHLPRASRWIGASAAAYAVIHGIGDSFPDPIALTTVSIIGGLALVGVYWLVGQQEKYWLGANVLGWFCAVQIGMSVSKTDHIIFGAVVGVVYGILTGSVLVKVSSKLRPLYVLGGLATILGGIFWVIKAASILVTGYQPLQIFEIGQALFALGVLGLYVRLPYPKRLAKIGAWVAGIGLIARFGAAIYEYLPGAVISTGEDFVFPYSLLVLLGAGGVFIGLPLVGLEIRQGYVFPSPWHAIPIFSAALFLPIALTGAIHIEIPILIMGFIWMIIGYTLWLPEARANRPEDEAYRK